MDCLWDVRAELGEGPLWLAEEQALLFVDIDGCRVHRYALGDGATRSWAVPAPLGCVARRARGGFVAAGAAGFVELELPGESARAVVRPLVDPEADLPGNRFNDGCCDAAGRFWAGSMDRACRRPRGALWRLDVDGTARRMDGGFVVSNGPALAPDGATLYHADTVAGVVHAYACDPARGELFERRVFARLPDGQGLPDGLTVDAEGGVWAAVWDGGRLVRWRPDGSLERELPVPVARPTKCAFGGPDLDLLFVTSSRGGLAGADLAGQPQAGALFVCRPGLAGLAPAAYGG